MNPHGLITMLILAEHWRAVTTLLPSYKSTIIPINNINTNNNNIITMILTWTFWIFFSCWFPGTGAIAALILRSLGCNTSPVTWNHDRECDNDILSMATMMMERIAPTMMIKDICFPFICMVGKITFSGTTSWYLNQQVDQNINNWRKCQLFM